MRSRQEGGCLGRRHAGGNGEFGAVDGGEDGVEAEGGGAGAEEERGWGGRSR